MKIQGSKQTARALDRMDWKSPDRKPLQENNFLKGSFANPLEGSVKKKGGNKIVFSS